MWKWLMLKLFGEIVYGVIDSKYQKKNWLGFTLIEKKPNSGFLFGINNKHLTIGMGDVSRVWIMPFVIKVNFSLLIDIFSSGCVSFYKNNICVFLVIMFWKQLYIKDEFFMTASHKISIKDKSISERNELFNDYTEEALLILKPNNDVFVNLIYTTTVYGRGGSPFTRYIMSFFGYSYISRMRIKSDSCEHNMILGYNTSNELTFKDMIDLINKRNSDILELCYN